MNTTDKKNILLGSVIGVIPVIWAALIAAPYMTNGLLEHVDKLSDAFRQPFQIRITENTLQTILIFLVIYAVSIGVWLSTRRNYRRGERPVKDLKYDILKHPNIALTEDGGAAPYLHGIADKADFSIQLTSAFLDHEDDQPAEPTGYELLSEEDLQHEFEKGEQLND